MRSLLTPRRVRIAERVGFGLYVLAAVFFVGRSYYLGDAHGTVAPSSASIAPSLPNTQASAPTAATSAPPTPAVVVPTPTPDPTRNPLTVSTYRSNGRRFAALGVPVGYTMVSPISGRVGVVIYQFLGGDVRIGSNIPSEPFFPYVTITSSESTLVLRPGALDRDVQLLVKDGQAVGVGTPLFKVVGTGPSSWRTFYDPTVTAQVIASLVGVPSGAELDPVALFAR